jgi:hypothetical protein
MAADLGPATTGFAQLQVGAGGARPGDHAPWGPRSLHVAHLPPSPLLPQAAFGKGDLEACKQLLSRLKVRRPGGGLEQLVAQQPVAGSHTAARPRSRSTSLLLTLGRPSPALLPARSWS